MYKLFHRYTLTNNSIYYLIDKSFIKPVCIRMSFGLFPKQLKSFTFYKDYEAVYSSNKQNLIQNLKLFKEMSYQDIVSLYDLNICKIAKEELELILINWDIN